jgi:hypothetical protein
VRRFGARWRDLVQRMREELDVLVSERTSNRMAEALQRANHALTVSSGLQVDDGKTTKTSCDSASRHSGWPT